MQFLKGCLPEANAVSDEVKLTHIDSQAVSEDKLKGVIRNSVFGDLLAEKFGVEFSKLSYAIESIPFL